MILVDMQPGFVSRLRPGAADIIIPKQREVLLKARRSDIPVAVLEFRAFGKTLPELIGAMKRADYEIFLKSQDSGFSDTQLNSWLKQNKAKTIFLMGINAGACVKATATDAISAGYRIVTSKNVIAGSVWHDPFDHADWYRANGTMLEF